MTASVVQEHFTGPSGTVTTATDVLSNTTAGNTLLFIVLTGATSSITGTPSDTQGNTYNALASALTVGNYNIKQWAAYGIVGGSAANTASVTIGSTNQWVGLLIEIKQLKTSPLDAQNLGGSATSGSGSNALTLAATSSANPNLAFAFAWAIGYPINVGTNIAWVGGQVNQSVPTLGGEFTTQNIRTTTTGSITAAWSPNSSNTCMTSLVIFDEKVTTASGLLINSNSGGF